MEIKFICDFISEENWLNNMIDKGKLLRKRSSWGRYYFNNIGSETYYYYIDEPKPFTRNFTENFYIKSKQNSGLDYLCKYGKRYYFVSSDVYAGNVERYENRKTRILKSFLLFISICITNLLLLDMKRYLFKFPPFSVVPDYLSSVAFAYNAFSTMIIIATVYMPILVGLIYLSALIYSIFSNPN